MFAKKMFGTYSVLTDWNPQITNHRCIPQKQPCTSQQGI